MIYAIKNLISGFFLLLFVFASGFFVFNEKSVLASEIQTQDLINKISKDYSKKFCNGIAFGLSKDSAMNFAIKENNLIFKNKKGFDIIDKELMANEIANSVLENCGFRIGLNDEEGLNEFANDYISMR